MRQLDCNIVYFDTFGRPLKGRVHFYEKNTTTDLAVYGSDGTTVLANPMYTTNGKLSPQVFLQDRDYSVVWEQYIGSGTMTIDDDPNDWRPAGSSISLQPSVTVSFDNVGLVCVENVAALRTVDPSQVSEGMVTLLGYSEKGDKPAINYIWDSTSTDSDDGCTVVKADGVATGRWKIVAYGDMDCRHFGIFPAATIDSTTDEQALAISAAHRYAVNYGVNIMLVQAEPYNASYYRLASGGYSCLFSQNRLARVVVESGDTVTLHQVGTYPIYVTAKDGFAGSVKMYGSYLHLSYCLAPSYPVTWYPSDRFYIDSSTQTAVPSSLDCTEYIPVFVEQASKSYAFVNMDHIEGKKLPSGMAFAFSKCVVGDFLFEDPSTVDVSDITMSECYIGIDNFYDVSRWVSFKFKAGEYSLDFGGRSVSSLSVSGTTTISLMNGSIGTLTSTAAIVDITNCAISSFSATGLGVLTAYGSSISGGITANSVELHSCSVGSVGSASSIASRLVADGTSFSGAIYAVLAECDGCIFASSVHTYAGTDNVANFRFNGCEFASTHYVNGADSTTEYTVKGSWTGNNFTASTPIKVNGVPYSGLNPYVYSGNGGTAVRSISEPFDLSGTIATANVTGVTNVSGMLKVDFAISMSTSAERFAISGTGALVGASVEGFVRVIHRLKPTSQYSTTLTVEKTVCYPVTANLRASGAYGTTTFNLSSYATEHDECVAFDPDTYGDKTFEDNGTTADYAFLQVVPKVN